MKKKKEEKKDAKSYKINLAETFEVTFIRDGAKFKKGNTTEVNLALASKFVRQGKIEYTAELKEAAEKAGCADLFKVTKTSKKSEIV